MAASQSETEIPFASPRKKAKGSNHQSLSKRLRPSRPPVYIPDELIENILSFFPIKEAVQAGLVSTRFKNSWLFSRNLNFGRDFSTLRNRLESIRIIDRVFHLHRGSKIKSFVLFLDHSGVQPLIETWIQKSIDKGVEELDLEFHDRGYAMRPSVDLSNVESIRILRLGFCEFTMSSNPKGLKFLHTLVLNQIRVSSVLIDSIFSNCFHLESLELIGCNKIRNLRIRARDQKKFSSFVVACCPDLARIDMDAPSLKSFQYCGIVHTFRFTNILEVKDIMLHYVRHMSFTQSFRAVDPLLDLSHVHVLTTTCVFLEGLTKRAVEGKYCEVAYRFWNLKEFQVFMEPPSFCNLFDIANFLKNCPFLERLYIDINDFTFELGMYWEAHQKQMIANFPYKLNSIRFVEIKGFKYHPHELDIVQFLLEKATYLETLALVTPKKNKARISYADYERIYSLKKLSAKAKIRVYEDFEYKSRIASKHVKHWCSR